MEDDDGARGRWLDVLMGVLEGFTPSVPWDLVCEELGRQLEAPVSGEFRWLDEGGVSIKAHPFPDWFDLCDVASRAPGLHPLTSFYVRAPVQ